MSCTLLAAVLTACSASGPQRAAPTSPPAAARPVVAFITHQQPGDAFWDVVRRGAQAAADADGLELRYERDDDARREADLVRKAAADRVAGIVVSLPIRPLWRPRSGPRWRRVSR